ncbi:MAG: HlyD family secretion protein [Oscillospiraceae bacterium]|nr:HlyD family secretion protein [Oscillospiraceae bacterium]
MKKKRKKIIIAAALLVVAAIVVVFVVNQNSGPQHPYVDTMFLERTDLQNTVSVTGTVQSTESKKVYSKLAYPVELLNVEVGDTVAEGDVLCQLDTSTLESNINQQNATVYKAQQTANLKIASAQKSLNDARKELENDLNTQILAAKAQVRTAEGALESASTQLLNLRLERGDIEIADMDLDDLNDYNADSRTQRVAYDNAKVALEDAKENLKAVEASAKSQLEDYEAGIVEAQASANVSDQLIGIEKLQADLADCTITSPMSGVVTGVYVNEGATPNGLMFVIEDTDSLKISTRVKEYDIANIRMNDPVEIKSDATGEDVYDGTLTKIAPTSVKNTQGDADTSSDAEFDAEIAVNSSGSGLLIGMKTRMNIVYEEKEQVYAVPYDAVTMNENGEEIIYIARKNEQGATIATPVVVESGMENDFFVEITSDEIADGDEIITSIDGITPNMQVMTASDMMAAAGGESGAGGAAAAAQ